MRRLTCISAIVVGLVAMPGAVVAQDSGRASATGSDSLTLDGRSYELFGVDGIELNQSCFVDGQAFACGASAVRALQTLLEPAAVTCAPRTTSVSGTTRATCTGHEGDIALKMVEQGWALADRSESDDYAAAEDAARASRVGAWRGKFLTPETYREQIAAVEARFAEVAGVAARAEVEAMLTTGELNLQGLKGGVPDTAVAGARGVKFEDHEVRFGAFGPGYINAAIQPPDVFDWTSVAAVLEASRREGVAEVEESIRGAIEEALAARPSLSVDTRDAESFYAALRGSSAQWIADGRQPILYVMTQDLPSWIRAWFAGQPPAGAEISHRDDRDSSDYLGTIDGVDVHVGPGRAQAALLVPSDILVGVTYRADDEGKVLALQVDEGNGWVLRYGVALRWLDDKLTWLTFPQAASATPDAG